MKLLFDENLSPKLVQALADLFSDCAHVDRIGLGNQLDTVVWDYAMEIATRAMLDAAGVGEKAEVVTIGKKAG